ncbi:MAG: hypothetical protein HN478_00755 [Rhodospirillaceae bacterium]|nr:hypothetical protein [Rhodospirillaceae bacterium]MBT4488308.1 hypothetical protein [Rhodospirillaceae bacterium]MBT5193841.1 hypothetical protein [Rhodospirillaceae bacterium]MBT5896517.1 hypothetical protein [Rhodospirillaceae bacterium]MBT6429989.1 hypothetical protein [Rhodospirillaceae bacterium]
MAQFYRGENDKSLKTANIFSQKVGMGFAAYSVKVEWHLARRLSLLHCLSIGQLSVPSDGWLNSALITIVVSAVSIPDLS